MKQIRISSKFYVDDFWKQYLSLAMANIVYMEIEAPVSEPTVVASPVSIHVHDFRVKLQLARLSTLASPPKA